MKQSFQFLLVFWMLQHFYEGYDECRKKFAFVLKQAKSMGKNGFYIFDEKDYEAFLRKGKIVAALRHAVVNQYNGFEVYYQPIVDCKSEKNPWSGSTYAFFNDFRKRI